ncbi:MAG: hypothetical protein M1541_03610 [Acidobacteria bacterium]|nr:hypothetical protein [Acidobacteriota bacterium]
MPYKPKPDQPDIQHDIKRPGALSARAKRNGRSVSEEAKTDEHKPGLAGQQARYFENVLKPAAKARSKHGDGKGHWSGH